MELHRGHSLGGRENHIQGRQRLGIEFQSPHADSRFSVNRLPKHDGGALPSFRLHVHLVANWGCARSHDFHAQMEVLIQMRDKAPYLWGGRIAPDHELGR